MVIKGWGIEKAGISIAETRLWHIDALVEGSLLLNSGVSSADYGSMSLYEQLCSCTVIC